MIWKNLPKNKHAWAFYYYCKRLGDRVKSRVHGNFVDIEVEKRDG